MLINEHKQHIGRYIAEPRYKKPHCKKKTAIRKTFRLSAKPPYTVEPHNKNPTIRNTAISSKMLDETFSPIS